MKQAEHISAYFEPPGKDSPLAGVGPADVHSREPRVLPLVSAGAQTHGDGVLATTKNVVFSQLAPWTFTTKQQNTKRTFRRTSFLTTRVLGNMGAAGSTPLLERFSSPVVKEKSEKRWLNSFYLDVPAEWDDPYRAFRW